MNGCKGDFYAQLSVDVSTLHVWVTSSCIRSEIAKNYLSVLQHYIIKWHKREASGTNGECGWDFETWCHSGKPTEVISILYCGEVDAYFLKKKVM